MKSLVNLLSAAWTLLTVTACTPAILQAATPFPSPVDSPLPVATTSPTVVGSSIHRVFEGITPCSALARPLPQIPADSNCEQMIWKLSLAQDPATGAPTTYTLNSAYGIPQQGTMGLVGGGTAITMEGNWRIVNGTALDPDAIVYQLNPDHPETTVSFQKMSEDILHVLTRDMTLLVGNAAWSYTLNRTDNRSPAPVNEQPEAEPDAPTRPPRPPTPSGTSVLGVFEGRAPCHEILFELLGMVPYSSCDRIKWQLTLYQDQNTGAPSTYLCLGTRTFREGTWTIVQGTESDPDAVVYQLYLDNAQQPVSLLKADDNHLFLLDRAMSLLAGDAQLSYTLSRIAHGAP